MLTQRAETALRRSGEEAPRTRLRGVPTKPEASGRAAQRARILDALYAVMSSSGTAAASVSEIAEAAGIARGALHYYFESKDEIVAALMRRLGDSYVARMSSFVDRCAGHGESAATALVRWHFSPFLTKDGHDDATRLLGVWIDFWGQAPSRKDIGDVVFAVQEAARALFRRALLLQRPELASLDDETLRLHGATLLAIVEGGLLQWRIAAHAPAPLDRDRLGVTLAAAAAAFVASIEPRPARSTPGVSDV